MSQTRYTATAILLHWLMAVLLVCLFGVGFYMQGLKLSPFKLQIYSWHKWAGVSVFLLVWLRLAWRFGHRPPALPAGMGRAVKAAAHAGHALLYLLMIAIPLSGWLMSSAKGIQTVYFGVLPLPDLIAPDRALGDSLQRLHGLLNYLLAAVVLGHVGAALKHHLIDRDDVLTRMLPWRIKS
ncbi:cytochrome b [Chromobacterium phragmitis]|uniref:Cytochrome b n=1 Tax=Chromobacterium phragmitis TaxID=2202141 RepID=A0A344UNR0_9NEIS|nr:cytochrome b [Chromobacterium phragmitis]AXE32508.1 cytochrome b [Chromobacterium phragmitis]AXE36908.1 cytochrome b [Chromobacterium phragmitis]